MRGDSDGTAFVTSELSMRLAVKSPETTMQDPRDMGSDGAGLSYPTRSVVADEDDG